MASAASRSALYVCGDKFCRPVQIGRGPLCISGTCMSGGKTRLGDAGLHGAKSVSSGLQSASRTLGLG